MQFSKCSAVYDYVLHRGHSIDEWLSASIFFRYERRMYFLFVLSWSRVREVALRSVLVRCTLGGVVFVIVFSVVDYGEGYGVGVCVNGCVVCCDFCLVCDACSWRCSFMGSIIMCFVV